MVGELDISSMSSTSGKVTMLKTAVFGSEQLFI